MAEGILRALYGDRFEVCSAGTEPVNVNPFAIKVMKEIGIDISNHRAKSVKEFLGEEFDLVVTVCDNAREKCPFLPGGKRYVHKGFEDPSQFRDDEEETLSAFRRIRNEIKDWIEKTFGEGNDISSNFTFIKREN